MEAGAKAGGASEKWRRGGGSVTLSYSTIDAALTAMPLCAKVTSRNAVYNDAIVM